jgi:predicted component of type VI protein secretion system
MANVDTATAPVVETPPTRARLRWRMANGRAGELLITAAALTIGRADDCGMVVDSALVSRIHCRIVAGDDGWTIEDAGSSNGTFVNGYQLTAKKRLASGDRIQLGLTPAQLEAEFMVDPPEVTMVAAADVDRWRERAQQLQKAVTESYEREAAAHAPSSRPARPPSAAWSPPCGPRSTS